MQIKNNIRDVTVPIILRFGDIIRRLIATPRSQQVRLKQTWVAVSLVILPFIVPIIIAAGASGKTNQEPNAIPILRLEKPKYVLGETIRFWVGVECQNNDATISKEFWNTCFLHVTRPDGTVKKEKASWPIDGMLDRGWSGGHGFGKEQVQVGKYILVFEFAGKKTEPVELIVEGLDVLQKVKAAFNFQRSGDVSENEHIPIILTVQNDSEYVIQFPRRGVSDAYISISVKRQEPAESADFFYPMDKLTNSFSKEASNISFDTYNWNVAAKVPHILLKPGESFEQELSLGDAYQFWGPGQYQVTFFTKLDLLVGEKNGKFADYCPIRLNIVNTENFRIRDIK